MNYKHGDGELDEDHIVEYEPSEEYRTIDGMSASFLFKCLQALNSGVRLFEGPYGEFSTGTLDEKFTGTSFKGKDNATYVDIQAYKTALRHRVQNTLDLNRFETGVRSFITSLEENKAIANLTRPNNALPVVRRSSFYRGSIESIVIEELNSMLLDNGPKLLSATYRMSMRNRVSLFNCLDQKEKETLLNNINNRAYEFILGKKNDVVINRFAQLNYQLFTSDQINLALQRFIINPNHAEKYVQAVRDIELIDMIANIAENSDIWGHITRMISMVEVRGFFNEDIPKIGSFSIDGADMELIRKYFSNRFSLFLGEASPFPVHNMEQHNRNENEFKNGIRARYSEAIVNIVTALPQWITAIDDNGDKSILRAIEDSISKIQEYERLIGIVSPDYIPQVSSTLIDSLQTLKKEIILSEKDIFSDDDIIPRGDDQHGEQ